MSVPMADSFEFIRQRVHEIRDESIPRCPLNGRIVFNCLREASRCPSVCPHHDGWMGPQPE